MSIVYCCSAEGDSQCALFPYFPMSYLIPISNYRPLLDMNATEQGIKVIKEFFADNLSTALRLRRVTAPLFVLRGLGINDDLSGKERAVNFPIKDLGDARAEVVHSLAKWKRLTLAEYGVQPGYGIYTDMNAIRADEELGNIHSLYVDQWDWERVIRPEDRTVDFLQEWFVRSMPRCSAPSIWCASVSRNSNRSCRPKSPSFTPKRCANFIPRSRPKSVKTPSCERRARVFIIGIGGALGDGEPHDLRAPDYDDYSTVSSLGLPGLNGDLLVWNNVLGRAFELSSMGIRVDPRSIGTSVA